MINRLQELYENKQYFEILEIKPTLDLKVISKAFREVASKYHPDKGGSHDEMVIIVDIMQKLSDKNYLQQYFQYTVTGDTFDENHFQFDTSFRAAKPENLQHYMDNIIQSMTASIKKAFNNVLKRAIEADPVADLRESVESPFEVHFHYKHKGRYGEIEVVIREELNDGEYWEQHFQHAITNKVFIDAIEKTTSFLATPENLQKKVNELIQEINEDTIKRPNEELFDELNSWLSQQMVEYKERAPAEIKPDFGKNTRRDMSQRWLKELVGLTGHGMKQDVVSNSNMRRIVAGAMFSASWVSSSVQSLPQPEYHSEHFEVDYYLLSLLTVASLTIAVALLYCLCQPGKASDSDNSIDRSARPG